MTDRSNFADLIATSLNRARRSSGTIVLPPEVLTASIDESGTPRALFGTIEEEEGQPRVRISGFNPVEGSTQIGELSARPTPEAGDVQIRPGSTPRAYLRGGELDIVSRDPSRYRDRIVALPGVEAIRGKSVALVGLGSVGSAIGAALVKLGLRVLACDADVLTVENLVRWGLPAEIDRHVGRTKSAVWRDILERTVPNASIEAHALDVVRDGVAFERALRSSLSGSTSAGDREKSGHRALTACIGRDQ